MLCPMPRPPLESLPPAAQRSAIQARLLRTLASASLPAVMVAMFLLWRYANVPFWTAAERCFIVGLAIYTTLALAAAIVLTYARLQPAALLVSHFTRLVSVGIFATLRYAQGLGFFRSAAAWLALYVVSAFVVRRIERRALRHLGAR